MKFYLWFYNFALPAVQRMEFSLKTMKLKTHDNRTYEYYVHMYIEKGKRKHKKINQQNQKPSS